MLDTILLCLKAVIVALTLKRKMDVFYSIKTFLIIPLKIESYRFALVTCPNSLFLYISANVHFCRNKCIQFYLQQEPSLLYYYFTSYNYSKLLYGLYLIVNNYCKY